MTALLVSYLGALFLLLVGWCLVGLYRAYMNGTTVEWNPNPTEPYPCVYDPACHADVVPPRMEHTE